MSRSREATQAALKNRRAEGPHVRSICRWLRDQLKSKCSWMVVVVISPPQAAIIDSYSRMDSYSMTTRPLGKMKEGMILQFCDKMYTYLIRKFNYNTYTYALLPLLSLFYTRYYISRYCTLRATYCCWRKNPAPARAQQPSHPPFNVAVWTYMRRCSISSLDLFAFITLLPE